MSESSSEVRPAYGAESGWDKPDGNDSRDPWRRREPGGPPDLDELLGKLQDKLKGLFGGGQKVPGAGLIFAILAVLFGLWMASGLYKVNEGERGVVLRFGQYQSTATPGLRWHWPYPVEGVEMVNIGRVRTVEVGYRSSARARTSASVPGESLMLTKDENIIDLKFAVQYKVFDPKSYLFNVREPDATLHQATESAVREVVGKNKMEHVLTGGREQVANEVQTLLSSILDRYEAGLLVTAVNMQDAQPPEEVQEAFSDAVKAREDEERQKNEAEAYRNDVLPRARGEAARLLAEASGYNAQVVAEATGDTERFNQVLTAYRRAPDVTRERLYIDSMESVLGDTPKVLMDTKGSGNLLYLPLDQLLGSRGGSSPESGDGVPFPSRTAPSSVGNKPVDTRKRETR
ncbi:MAG: FtsH protease activity modulator HflK [Gammaproteobacteria bacterium]|nr:FtsH protease activity modulator HflK [Gammaproteobacteria bacterium]